MIAVSIKVNNWPYEINHTACLFRKCTRCSKNVSPPTNVGNIIKLPRTYSATNFGKIGCAAQLSSEGFDQTDYVRASASISLAHLANSVFFFWLEHMVQVIGSKILQKWSEGKQNLLQVSGKFELSRVQVTEGEIAVNVWWKFRGENRFWFESVRI